VKVELLIITQAYLHLSATCEKNDMLGPVGLWPSYSILSFSESYTSALQVSQQ